MHRHELVKKVAIALTDCRTANNDAITSYFTMAEINDFANTIVAYLPETFDKQIDDLNTEVLDMIADKKDFIFAVYLKLVKSVYAKLLKSQTNISMQLVHLIVLSTVILKDKYDVDIDDAINSGISYYKSMLLSSDDLAKNIHAVPARGAISEFDNKGNYLRIDYDNIRFVPTLTTKQNFNYLIPEEWNK